MNNLKYLTFITITRNDPGLLQTYQSLEPFLKCGATHLIQNGGEELNNMLYPLSTIHTESDDGIYNAINKGIQRVRTKYFILIHSSDIIIAKTNELQIILNDMENYDYKLSLNSQYIGLRLHSVRLWHPVMLSFGVQPPHMPSIFNTEYFGHIQYDESIEVISDFDFFSNLDYDFKYIKHNICIVKMATGGATSNGLMSFFAVSKLFIQYYGLNGLFMSICRIPIKLIQAIR